MFSAVDDRDGVRRVSFSDGAVLNDWEWARDAAQNISGRLRSVKADAHDAGRQVWSSPQIADMRPRPADFHERRSDSSAFTFAAFVLSQVDFVAHRAIGIFHHFDHPHI